jgi:hypothetical protein
LLKPEFFCRLEIQNHVLEEARTLVNKITSGRQWPAIVMHVRRGDYLGHSTYGLTEVVLTEDYFKRALKLARNHIGSNAEVLIVTDDQIWCNQFLSDMQPFTVVSSSEAVDFALLSMFRVAIISNSTFSLAAACVSKTVEHVFAPEYWFGHSVGEWYPPRVRVKDRRFTYV